jgi:beta-glucosidase-like glycosyl hydrolase
MIKIITGIQGFALTQLEVNLLSSLQPFGVILFKRNCETREQVTALTSSIKTHVPCCQIFIDQEGGRVQRLPWRQDPPLLSFEYKDSQELYESCLNMGTELKNLGIDVDCAPCCDVYIKGADPVIGNRAFSSNPKRILELYYVWKRAFDEVGLGCIIKHIPGLGRASCDPHSHITIINTLIDTLKNEDFWVFKEISQHYQGMAMTSHAIIEALDPTTPVTLSKLAIDYIRNDIGFKGTLITDCLRMNALNPLSLKERIYQSAEAGCDIQLVSTPVSRELLDMVL